LTRRARALNGRTYPWTDLDPERRNALLLYAGIGFVVALALVLIGYGYYTDRVAPGHETVLRVGSRAFDLNDLERRAKAEARQGLSGQSDLSQIIGGALTKMEREEVLRQTGERRSLSLSEAELDASLRTRLQLTAEATREQLASRLRGELLRLGLSLGEFQAITRADAVETKLQAQSREAIPAEAEQVDLLLIQVGSQSQALEIRDLLGQGTTTFAVQAATKSIHSSRSSAGELGWIPREALPKEVAGAAFALEAGATSDIVEIKQGFFILQARGKETRAVDDNAKTRVVDQALSASLQETRDAAGVTSTLTEDQLRRIAAEVAAAATANSLGG